MGRIYRLDTSLHSPESVVLALDLRDLLERSLLVRVQRLVPEGPRRRLREVHVQDVPALHLPADGDPVDRDRDLRPRDRFRDDLLPLPDRPHAPEGLAVVPHQGEAGSQPTREDADPEDRGLARAEHELREEQQLRRVRPLETAGDVDLLLPLLHPRLVALEEAVDHVPREDLHVRVLRELLLASSRSGTLNARITRWR